jgi:hypothetical protein
LPISLATAARASAEGSCCNFTNISLETPIPFQYFVLILSLHHSSG